MSSYVFIFTIFNIILYASCQLQSTFVKPLANGTSGISTGAPIVQQLTTTVSYAGGLFWTDDGVKLAYIDRYGPAFGRYTPDDGRFNRLQLSEGKQSIVIFPVKNATGLRFAIGLDNLIVLVNVTGTGNDLSYTSYYSITVSNKKEKFMRGRCDSKGRLWYSSSGHGKYERGNLYKIENLGQPEIMLSNLRGGAGMAWTADYKYFYLVDSELGVIYKYNFDENNGTISNESIIFRLKDQPTLSGKPFDITVDTNGSLWIGMFGGGAVIQYDENTATVIWQIAIPASDIVSLEFGGLDKKTLFVGTKKVDSVASGAIFGVSGLGVTGIPDNDIVVPEEYTTL